MEEIEIAIDRLPAADYRRVVDWVRAREGSRWDSRMDDDSASGKLDVLFAEAETEAAQGLLHDWPPRE